MIKIIENGVIVPNINNPFAFTIIYNPTNTASAKKNDNPKYMNIRYYSFICSLIIMFIECCSRKYENESIIDADAMHHCGTVGESAKKLN